LLAAFPDRPAADRRWAARAAPCPLLASARGPKCPSLRLARFRRSAAKPADFSHSAPALRAARLAKLLSLAARSSRWRTPGAVNGRPSRLRLRTNAALTASHSALCSRAAAASAAIACPRSTIAIEPARRHGARQKLGRATRVGQAANTSDATLLLEPALVGLALAVRVVGLAVDADALATATPARSTTKARVG